jgi:hypothetical protein
MTQLTNLLASSADNQIAVECSEWISRGDDLRHGASVSLPLAQAIDIYSVRARINAARGGNVEGYEQLLPALEGAALSSVRLHALEFLSHWFIAFTDEAITCLLGILKSRKHEEAWYDPAAGYDG